MSRTLVSLNIKGDKQMREALRDMRKEMGKIAKAELLDAIETHAVPAAKAASPSIYASHIHAFATTRGGGITVRGSKSLKRTAGYLEHGGTIRGKHGGYLVFQIHGEWKRVRYVHREVVKEGRYILPTISSDRVRSRVLRQLNNNLTPRLRSFAAQAGGQYVPQPA